jgi:hypothetical protein
LQIEEGKTPRPRGLHEEAVQAVYLGQDPPMTPVSERIGHKREHDPTGCLAHPVAEGAEALAVGPQPLGVTGGSAEERAAEDDQSHVRPEGGHVF